MMTTTYKHNGDDTYTAQPITDSVEVPNACGCQQGVWQIVRRPKLEEHFMQLYETEETK